MSPSEGSMDASVFPPFIPGAAPTRRAPEPSPAPRPEPAATAAPEPEFDPEPEFIESYAPEPSALEGAAGAAVAEAEEEDLPWLELPPGSRHTADEEAAGPGATDDAAADPESVPDWLAWDERAEVEAREEVEAEAPAPWTNDLVLGDDLMQPDFGAPAAEEAEAGEEPETPGVWIPSDEAWSAAGETDEAAGAEVGDGAEEEAWSQPAASAVPENGAEALWGDVETGLEPPPEPPVEGAVADAIAEVAARLERLAQTLRERPGDLLAADTTDPLDLLVAGYALGLAQGRAQGRAG